MNQGVQIKLTPQTQARLDELARETGRKADDLVEDALFGYFDEVGRLREVLESRYDDLENGRVTAIDGDVAQAHLREKSCIRRSERQG
jgi:predicted transcriptional regulator